ncbi:MAG: tetratricopeptide repeat protein, partial [Bdellovibrionota bacterium]
LSVASKEEGITLPAMIVLTELFLSRGTVVARLKKAATSVLPYAAMAVVLAAWIYAMHPTEGNESRGFVSPFEYFITQWRAYLWYMRLWFWPFDLNADNASIVYSKSLSDSLVIQAAIGNLALLAFAWASRRKWPALLFGVLWFYVTISPASSVIVLAEAINEHRMYLAYIGFVGGTFTVLLALAPSLKPRVLGVLFVAIMAGFFYGSRERNRVWLSDENLWADTVEKNPTSGRALNNLALVYMSQGRYPEAIQMLERCEQAWSTYMYCPLNIGVADTALGFNARGNGKKDEADRLFAQAEKAYRRALDLNPKNVHANFHLARYYQDVRQDWNKALEMFTTAVDVTGGRYPAADVQRALCLEKLGRRAEADRALDRALSVEPTSGAALFEKARIAFEGGQIPQSIATYRQLLQVEPGNNLAWYNLSVALIQKGDIPAARETLERFLKLDPSSEQGLFNMIYVSDRLGDGSGAVRAATELARLRPAKGEYRGRLEELRKKYGASAS